MLTWLITHPRYVIAIVTHKGRVVQAPPIAAWARGRSWDMVRKYYSRVNAKIEPLDPNGPFEGP